MKHLLPKIEKIFGIWLVVQRVPRNECTERRQFLVSARLRVNQNLGEESFLAIHSKKVNAFHQISSFLQSEGEYLSP